MKIKTIIRNTDHVEKFDEEVNEAIADGWILVKREVLPGMQYNATNWAWRALYAELVLPDPAPEPEPVAVDPWELARQLKAFCDSVPKADCVERRCPLLPLCNMMLSNKAIDEWEV